MSSATSTVDDLSSSTSDDSRTHSPEPITSPSSLCRPVSSVTYERFKQFTVVVLYGTALTFTFHIRNVRELVSTHITQQNGTPGAGTGASQSTYSSLSPYFFPISCFITAYVGHTFLRECEKDAICSLTLVLNVLMLSWWRFVSEYRHSISLYEESITSCENVNMKGMWIEKVNMCFCTCLSEGNDRGRERGSYYCVMDAISDDACSSLQGRLTEAIESLSVLELPVLVVLCVFVLFYVYTSICPPVKGEREEEREGEFVYDRVSLHENEDEDDGEEGEEGMEIEGERGQHQVIEIDDGYTIGIEMSSLITNYSSRECPVLAQAKVRIVSPNDDNIASVSPFGVSNIPPVLVEVIHSEESV